MTISSSMKKASTLAALVSGLFAAATISPRALEAQQRPQPVQRMDVYVLGKTDTTHVGVAAVPKKGSLAKIDRSGGRTVYLGDARLIDENGAAVTLQAQEGDKIAFVPRSAQAEHRLRAPRLDIGYENLTLAGKGVRAAVIDAAELYAQSRGSPVIRMLRGTGANTQGVSVVFNMNYQGQQVAQGRRMARPDMRIPIGGKDAVVPPPTPTPPDTVYVPTPPDTVRVPMPPDTVTLRIIPPVKPVHSQLDLGVGYLRERTETPTLDALFRSWGLFGQYNYSDDRTLGHVDAGAFGKPLFEGKYTETVNNTTTRGKANRSFINALLMQRVGGGPVPLGVGIGNDFDWFNADGNFNSKQEARNYTSLRAGLMWNKDNGYGQVSLGAGPMIVDGSQMNTVTGLAWDAKARAAFMPASRVELGLHGGYRNYSNLNGASCCEEVTMDGNLYTAGAHLKFPLFGARSNVRPIVGAELWRDEFTGTNDDPRTGTMFWGGLGINFGREAQPARTVRITTSQMLKDGILYVETPKDSTRKYTNLGPQMRPAGVTRSYQR